MTPGGWGELIVGSAIAFVLVVTAILAWVLLGAGVVWLVMALV